MSQDILAYIKENIAAGKERSEIEKTLTQYGWKDEQIDTAFEQLKNPPVNPELEQNIPAWRQSASNVPVSAELVPSVTEIPFYREMWFYAVIILASFGFFGFFDRTFEFIRAALLSPPYSSSLLSLVGTEQNIFWLSTVPHLALLLIPGIFIVSILGKFKKFPLIFLAIGGFLELGINLYILDQFHLLNIVSLLKIVLPFSNGYAVFGAVMLDMFLILGTVLLFFKFLGEKLRIVRFETKVLAIFFIIFSLYLFCFFVTPNLFIQINTFLISPFSKPQTLRYPLR